MDIEQIIGDEAGRRAAFPVASEQAFFGHAGVSPLPQRVADALRRYADEGSRQLQESPWAEQQVKRARELAGRMIAADADEIALLGPTSLGINLVAHGLDWQAGDQVVYYADDYPANVYAWMELARRGVEPIAIETDAHLNGQLGAITWQRIEPLITDRTRLVSLASCNFISGYRIDHARIGRELHDRGVLFCLDGIQTVGAFDTSVEHVDFLAADSHKWMLGPDGAGIFYVAREHHERLRPSLLGSWNVRSPQFIAQHEIRFYPGARQYEPGMLNHPGIVGMAEGLELLLETGVDAISDRLRALHAMLVDEVRPLGLECYLPDMPDAARTGIVTLRQPEADLRALHRGLADAGVFVSLRHDRSGQPLLRFSPHFYNTEAEIDLALQAISAARS